MARNYLLLIKNGFDRSSSSSPPPRPITDMEDRNILAADCIVVCCCCECMIMQILIFVLLKLPHKVFKRTKQYTKKLRACKRGSKVLQIQMARNREDSFRIEMEDFCSVESPRLGCCMAEIETVLYDLSSKGEFAFGSFWGAEASSSRSFYSCFEYDQVDYDVVGYRLMELFGSANFCCH